MKKIKILLLMCLVIAITSVSIYFIRQYFFDSYNTTENIIISDTILTVITKSKHKEHKKIVEELIKEIERSDTVLNPYNPDSEISLVNKAVLEGKREIPLSEELAYLFELGLEASDKTDGRYSIGVQALMKLWGFGYKTPSVPNKAEMEKIVKNNTGTYDVSVKEKNGKYILYLQRPVTFDLGSYGKGYILGRMKEIADKSNIQNYLINYGGDIAMNGVNGKGKPWGIGIKNPRYDGTGKEDIALLREESGSVVTSGDYARCFFENGIRYNHIIDAKTGMSVTNSSASATIVHKNPIAADMLSTIAFMYGTNFFTNNIFEYKECYIAVEEPLSGEIFLYGKTNY